MLCALIILSFSDNPLFTGIGLLLWILLAQTVIQALLPYPTLVAVLGLLQLLLALTCGYLALADRVTQVAAQVVATDITFPDSVTPVDISDIDNSVEVLPVPGLPRRLQGRAATGEHVVVRRGP